MTAAAAGAHTSQERTFNAGIGSSAGCGRIGSDRQIRDLIIQNCRSIGTTADAAHGRIQAGRGQRSAIPVPDRRRCRLTLSMTTISDQRADGAAAARLVVRNEQDRDCIGSGRQHYQHHGQYWLHQQIQTYREAPQRHPTSNYSSHCNKPPKRRCKAKIQLTNIRDGPTPSKTV